MGINEACVTPIVVKNEAIFLQINNENPHYSKIVRLPFGGLTDHVIEILKEHKEVVVTKNGRFPLKETSVLSGILLILLIYTIGYCLYLHHPV